MASNQHPLAPTCSICFECFDYRNHCPCVLHCGHSVCSGCLEESRNGNAITCPTCRQTCTVGDLRKNFELLKTVDTINATPQLAENESSPVCEEIAALATATSHAEKIIAAKDRVLNVMFSMFNNREKWTSFIRDLFEFEVSLSLLYRHVSVPQYERFSNAFLCT